MAQGTFHDGLSSRRHSVSVAREAADLVLRDDSETILARWPLAEVRLLDRPDGERPGRLGLGRSGDARLMLFQADFNVIAPWCPNLTKSDVTWQSHGRPMLLWGGGATLSVLLLFFVVLPWLARVVALSLPGDWERDLGQATEEFLITTIARLDGKDPDRMVCAGKDGALILARINQRLATDSRMGLEHPPSLTVIDTDLVNALALPGGRMLLFRGLIEEVEHPNELVGVLAHEMGHLAKRHPTEMAVQAAGTSVLISLLIGDVTGGAALALLGESVINGVYSRDKEREADDLAVAIMTTAGWDPKPFARFFDRLAEDQGSLEETLAWVSSHPLSENRATAIREIQGPDGIAMTDLEWAKVNGICGGRSE
ncbi:M48 family metallopeptidase [Magnetospira sp. QH-2]|uniref:M48 family metallopeptidase n=1 Tax=Magnetospira sp. (strain QH-2) TaxID=1288970 RepID=UPI0003E815DC|nr:M48 family metallopeptidase [Magnetospira sp. QH-2]CCQ75333.1 conserved protein of unknown function[Include peptidase M48 domain] [Magnetospira sp. QH-2]